MSTSSHRISNSGPEPFEACPDGGRCWHACPLLPASETHPEGEGLPCWRVLFAGPLSDAYPEDEWPPGMWDTHEAVDLARDAAAQETEA